MMSLLHVAHQYHAGVYLLFMFVAAVGVFGIGIGLFIQSLEDQR